MIPVLIIESMLVRAPAHQRHPATPTSRLDSGPPRQNLTPSKSITAAKSPGQEEQDNDWFDEYSFTSEDDITKTLIQHCICNRPAGEKGKDGDKSDALPSREVPHLLLTASVCCVRYLMSELRQLLQSRKALSVLNNLDQHGVGVRCQMV